MSFKNDHQNKIIELSLTYDQSIEDHIHKLYPNCKSFEILSRSLDARGAPKGKKPRVHYRVHLQPEQRDEEVFKKLKWSGPRPVIVGSGPAGLFCALRLLEYGVPSVVLERGDQTHQRMKKIARYWRYGEFHPQSNVCFGEGGAGLFSDGKLITRIKSPLVDYVMQKLVQMGAPENIQYESNPHLGSNVIRQLIAKVTQSLQSQGTEVRFNALVKDLLLENGKVRGVVLENGEEIESEHVILATGHSARDVYEFLYKKNIAMGPKDYALGVRIEHPRKLINRIQFGPFANDQKLGTARYRLSWEDPGNQRGSYSFCMCPGGYVLSSGTESDGLVVNGMSNVAQNSPWSNAALVVTVRAGEDYQAEKVMAGLQYQREVEHQAYLMSKKASDGCAVPAQRASDFVNNVLSRDLPKYSCPSGATAQNLHQILPSAVALQLGKALQEFDRRMPGFLDEQALLMAPETRTSAPLRVLRDKQTYMSTNTWGLYPCGEGAGFAGGITSAAVDGIKVAEAIVRGA